jgi:hypothetical protein
MTEENKVPREITLAYMAEVIKNLEKFLDVPENKQKYQNSEGWFFGFVINEPRQIEDRQFATWLDEMDMLADALLITSLGQPDFKAHQTLKDLCDVIIRRGEYDDFGWLSGIICARNFRYVYG